MSDIPTCHHGSFILKQSDAHWYLISSEFENLFDEELETGYEDGYENFTSIFDMNRINGPHSIIITDYYESPEG